MLKIFISYRRQDSENITGRLHDHLEGHFGQHAVFMDVDTIPYGADFRRYLEQAVSRCDVLLAIIGTQWLACRHQEGPRQGDRRLDDPGDFVRIEIQSALARGIPVIPVLVDRAVMPAAQDLPEALQALAYRHAAEVRGGREFRDHMARLIEGIESLGQKLARHRQVDPNAKPTPLPAKTAASSVAGRNRFFFRLTLPAVAWLVGAVFWAIWTYWTFVLVGDRDKGRLREDLTLKIWICVAWATALVTLLAWIVYGVRRFRSQAAEQR